MINSQHIYIYIYILTFYIAMSLDKMGEVKTTRCVNTSHRNFYVSNLRIIGYMGSKRSSSQICQLIILKGSESILLNFAIDL